MKGLLYTIAVILIIAWVVGLILKVATSFIHLLLVLAVIFIVVNLFKGRNRV